MLEVSNFGFNNYFTRMRTFCWADLIRLLSGSSGMAEVRWRDSRMSSSNSPPDPIHRQYAEELQPQVVGYI
jgi:hypothetical protein